MSKWGYNPMSNYTRDCPYFLRGYVYRMLKFKVEYPAIGADEYDKHFREREIHYLQRKAARLGFTLSPAQNVPTAAVS